MKFLQFASLLALSSTAFGQDLSIIPTCALTCFTNGAAAGKCGITDLVCQCTTGKEAVTASVTPCIASSCDTADQSKAAAAAVQICAEALGSTSSSSVASKTTAAGKTSTTTNSNGNVTLATGGVTVSTGGAPGSNAELIAAGAGVIAALLL